MGTRSGDLDPGLASYLMLGESMSAAQWQSMVNRESGLLGISETSADVRDLLERENTDSRAREALAIFCYQAKKWIGAYTAALGGLDTLVFAGGIGENSAAVRRRICDGLQCLGIELDDALNERHAAANFHGRRRRAHHPHRRGIRDRKPDRAVLGAIERRIEPCRTIAERRYSMRIWRAKMDAYWRAANYLSVGQIYLCDNPLAEGAAGGCAHQAHAAGTLGHHAGPELHLHALESRHQEIRFGHDLHVRARAWRPRGGQRYLPRGHLQRGLLRISARTKRA